MPVERKEERRVQKYSPEMKYLTPILQSLSRTQYPTKTYQKFKCGDFNAQIELLSSSEIRFQFSIQVLKDQIRYTANSSSKSYHLFINNFSLPGLTFSVFNNCPQFYQSIKNSINQRNVQIGPRGELRLLLLVKDPSLIQPFQSNRKRENSIQSCQKSQYSGCQFDRLGVQFLDSRSAISESPSVVIPQGILRNLELKPYEDKKPLLNTPNQQGVHSEALEHILGWISFIDAEIRCLQELISPDLDQAKLLAQNIETLEELEVQSQRLDKEIDLLQAEMSSILEKDSSKSAFSSRELVIQKNADFRLGEKGEKKFSKVDHLSALHPNERNLRRREENMFAISEEKNSLEQQHGVEHQRLKLTSNPVEFQNREEAEQCKIQSSELAEQSLEIKLKSNNSSINRAHENQKLQVSLLPQNTLKVMNANQNQVKKTEITSGYLEQFDTQTLAGRKGKSKQFFGPEQNSLIAQSRKTLRFLEFGVREYENSVESPKGDSSIQISIHQNGLDEGLKQLLTGCGDSYSNGQQSKNLHEKTDMPEKIPFISNALEQKQQNLDFSVLEKFDKSSSDKIWGIQHEVKESILPQAEIFDFTQSMINVESNLRKLPIIDSNSGLLPEFRKDVSFQQTTSEISRLQKYPLLFLHSNLSFASSNSDSITVTERYPGGCAEMKIPSAPHLFFMKDNASKFRFEQHLSALPLGKDQIKVTLDTSMAKSSLVLFGIIKSNQLLIKNTALTTIHLSESIHYDFHTGYCLYSEKGIRKKIETQKATVVVLRTWLKHDKRLVEWAAGGIILTSISIQEDNYYLKLEMANPGSILVMF